MNRIKVAVATPGTGVFILETVKAYKESQNLYKFYTSFVSNINLPFYNRIKGTKIEKELNRRRIDNDIIDYVKTYPYLELFRTISSRFFNEKITDYIYEYSEYSFDRWVAKQLDKSIDIIHCYEHSSLETIKRAKELGIFVVYEQPSQHHSFLTPIFDQQFKDNPKLLTKTNKDLIFDKAVQRNARRDLELKLSDLIICNSTFTKKTLTNIGIEPNKIKVVPLGFPETNLNDLPHDANKTTRFIYAGTSNIRKGIHLLIDVWVENFNNRNDLELYIVGKFDLPIDYKNRQCDNIHFIDSIPRNELLQNFCNSDVLILPTLADGFGMVITEAMSKGLCVMCTENSAGPDIIKHEFDGLIFKANSKSDLADTIQKWSIRKSDLIRMGKEAKITASKYQWSDYRKNLTSTILNTFYEQ